jgi:hypothetical protein
VTITACSRAAAVQRGLPAPDPLARASARQRSNVATPIPTSRDTKSIAELSGGNSRATIRSLYACPYRATVCYPRPQRFRSYLGGNLSDTGGLLRGVAITRKNFMFVGSDRGGDRAAIFYTLIETAKLNGLDPEAYIAAVIDRMAKGHNSKALDALLPWNFMLPKTAPE